MFFLDGWILPIGGVASRRVCVCSLSSRLVHTENIKTTTHWTPFLELLLLPGPGLTVTLQWTGAPPPPRIFGFLQTPPSTFQDVCLLAGTSLHLSGCLAPCRQTLLSILSIFFFCSQSLIMENFAQDIAQKKIIKVHYLRVKRSHTKRKLNETNLIFQYVCTNLKFLCKVS